MVPTRKSVRRPVRRSIQGAQARDCGELALHAGSLPHFERGLVRSDFFGRSVVRTKAFGLEVFLGKFIADFLQLNAQTTSFVGVDAPLAFERCDEFMDDGIVTVQAVESGLANAL
jgi:hypothetical protein